MVFEENKNLIFLEAIELTCKLSRKRPSPLKGGRTKTWVVAILNTIISILIIEEVKEEFEEEDYYNNRFKQGDSMDMASYR